MRVRVRVRVGVGVGGCVGVCVCVRVRACVLYIYICVCDYVCVIMCVRNGSFSLRRKMQRFAPSECNQIVL